MVAAENPVEHLIETYKLMFPGKSVTPMMFASLTKEHMDAANDYVADAARRYGFPALFSPTRAFPAPVESRVRSGGFLGIKCYLTHGA